MTINFVWGCSYERSRIGYATDYSKTRREPLADRSTRLRAISRGAGSRASNPPRGVEAGGRTRGEHVGVDVGVVRDAVPRGDRRAGVRVPRGPRVSSRKEHLAGHRGARCPVRRRRPRARPRREPRSPALSRRDHRRSRGRGRILGERRRGGRRVRRGGVSRHRHASPRCGSRHPALPRRRLRARIALPTLPRRLHRRNRLQRHRRRSHGAHQQGHARHPRLGRRRIHG